MTSARGWHPRLASALAVTCILASIAGPLHAAAPNPDDSRTMLLAIRVNGTPVENEWQVVRALDGFHATAEAFAAWRLRLPGGTPVKMQGRSVYPLQSPIQVTLDPSTQTLTIDAPATAFVSSTLKGDEAPAVAPTPSPPGAFLNYDVQLTRDRGGSRLGGAIEVGVFGKHGVLTTTAVARDVGAKAELVRLQTAFARDDPATATTLRIGDSVGAASSWGRRMYFGGVQWGSNFSTRPEMVLLPLPSMRGEAVQPSVVDLYVNNVLNTRREVPSGPFTFNQLPIATGAGEVRMVVRDVLGREQVVNLDYYLSPQLLRHGLHEFSWEGGAQRERLGTASNDYGAWFAATSHRYGVSDRLTLEGRAEVQRGLGVAGAGAVYQAGNLGTVSGGAVASISNEGAGARGHAQFQRVARQWSVSGRLEASTRNFRQAGLAEGELPPAYGAQLFASVSFAPRQALSAGLVLMKNRGERADVSLATVGYSVEIGPRLSASVSAYGSLVDASAWGALVSLSYALDDRRFLSGSASRTAGGTQGTMQLQQGLPTDTGFGYDLRANVGNANGFGGRLLYQNDYGNFGVEASNAGRRFTYAASAAGGVASIGGHTLFSRRLQDSFAMVEVPGAKGVDIYSNNQRITSTNAAGVGLVPNLLPYQRNTLRLDDRGLPVEMELDLDERTVTPRSRSGVLVTFAARRNDGATLTILTDDGTPMALGSEVLKEDGTRAAFVARRGEVFLPVIAYPLTLRVRYGGRACSFKVEAPQSPVPLPRLGPFKCRPSLHRASS